MRSPRVGDLAVVGETLKKKPVDHEGPPAKNPESKGLVKARG